ncbi:Phage tail assembly chaperone protein [Pseudomonas palleroniana]|uniref:Phage tail assembly chaperone protein n=1 Tax=Pseudomonas palleroniana TaxID=191390 RepID=A0A1H5HQU7_9PSED|nr:Phage tail assembly chaperone protein [Pseudomonas palleroniana]
MGFQYKPNPESIALAEWASIRTLRQQLLASTEAMLSLDNSLTDTQRSEVSLYRQALRDVPQGSGDPYKVVWPESPTFLK